MSTSDNPEPQAQAWEKLEAAIDHYIEGYELRDCEDGDGNSGDYTPTENERMLITDCIMGLLADDEIMAMIKALP
jgi:hypothetical protein